MSTAEEKVKKAISDQLGISVENINLNSHLIDDLDADSLDIVELTMELEEQFECLISTEEADNLQTVGDLVKWLDSVNKS